MTITTIRYLLLSSLAFSSSAWAQDQPEADVPPPVPAKSTPAMKTTKTGRYNIPMSFDPNESGVAQAAPEIDYDLTLDGGKTLRIGNIRFNERTFTFVLRPISAFHPQLGDLAGKEGKVPALVIRWPEALLKSGQLEVISRSGTVIWKYEITPEAVEKWKKQVGEWKATLKSRGVADKVLRSGLFATQFAITDLQERGAPFWKTSEIFRFCLTQAEGKSQTRLCSQRYGARAKGNQVMMGRVASAAASPRVLVMNENAPLKASTPVPADGPAQFYADLASGESYEFLAPPSKLDLVDLSDTTRAGLLRVSGFGVRPTDPSIILNKDQFGKLTTMLGFQPTIGDDRKFWAAAVKKAEPRLHFPGQGGGVFKHRLELQMIPRGAARPHIDRLTPKATYIDGMTVRGRKQPNSSVSSSQNSAANNPQDPTLFTWQFRALEKGEMNKSYLDITYEGQTFKAFHEVYRGYGKELSGRFSGILAAGSFLFMGELAYNHWFENLFGWDHPVWATQRWGISGKYFKSVTQLPLDGGTKANLDVMTLDLKYRATPGIWTRDESVGAILAYQNVAFDQVKASMLGVGWFWARSMPKVFDDLFNLLPFMEYPKWVDMEFIYFMNSLNANVRLNNTMALNFHGQVLWRKNIFGEAGFGFKRYAFADSAVGKEAKLNTFYGTVGLGMKF